MATSTTTISRETTTHFKVFKKNKCIYTHKKHRLILIGQFFYYNPTSKYLQPANIEFRVVGFHQMYQNNNLYHHIYKLQPNVSRVGLQAANWQQALLF